MTLREEIEETRRLAEARLAIDPFDAEASAALEMVAKQTEALDDLEAEARADTRSSHG
jgi:hypothetical protein